MARNRAQFIEEMRSKSLQEISPRDCRIYLDDFGDYPTSYLKGGDMFGPAAVKRLGRAMRKYWALAMETYIVEGKSPVEVFEGMFLVHTRTPDPKWDYVFKLSTKECRAEIKRLIGMDI